MSQGNMDLLSWVFRDPHEAADEIERLRAALKLAIDARDAGNLDLLRAVLDQEGRAALEQKANTE